MSKVVSYKSLKLFPNSVPITLAAINIANAAHGFAIEKVTIAASAKIETDVPVNNWNP